MSFSTRISRRTALGAGGALAGGLALGAGVTPAAHADPPWQVELSTAQQVGQRVIFSYPTATPPADLLQLIRDGMVGGVIFFGENITSKAQITEVVSELRAAHAQSPAAASPLILTTDQEGGIVRRLKWAEPFLTEREVGDSADPLAAATHAGAGAGAALKDVGMNLNLAPVLDVFRVEGNFDDRFGRSYSMDPAVCGRLGRAFVTAQQAEDVAATAKHFPGLGAAARGQNTDLGVVTLTQSAQEIRSVDEAAFVPAIRAGVDLVMTSWATYPAIDPDYPSGLSEIFVRGELRRRLQFRGVTITDALEAGALAPFGDTGARAVRAADVGMDLLLCSGRDVDQGRAAAAAVTDAVEGGRLNPGHFRIALRRVRRLRDRLF